MSQCPSCQAELTEDFGLIDCPGCGAVLFVDMDGTVNAQDSSLDSNLSGEAPVELPPDMDSIEEFSLDSDIDAQAETQFQSIPEPEPAVIEEMQYQEPQESFEENLFQDESVSIGDDAPLEVAAPVSSPIMPGEDLSNLANAIDGGAETTGLRYNLIIQGIDTSDLRKEAREALLDSKFGWDVDHLLKSIQAGKLEIKSVSAVKAQIVVQRLKSLPLKIHWEQHADI